MTFDLTDKGRKRNRTKSPDFSSAKKRYYNRNRGRSQRDNT